MIKNELRSQAQNGEERDMFFMSAVLSLNKSKDSSFWCLLPKRPFLSIRDRDRVFLLPSPGVWVQ